MKWRPLRIPQQELCIEVNLISGQSFRWIKTGPREFTSVLRGHLISLKQTGALDDDTLFALPLDDVHADKARAILHDYFQLDVDLESKYKDWCRMDPVFKQKARLQGIRLLRIDPVENLFSFICSSNNNIARISQMVQKLCTHYGQWVGTYQDIAFHDFPEIHSLSLPAVEQHLRTLGFGYRAKYIAQTAQHLTDLHTHPAAYLYTLREKPYAEARDALLKLPGVGPKVADCICLMSLDKRGSVPVDTHVRLIAEKWYGLRVKGQSLTRDGYAKVQGLFEGLFGEDAGWAHAVLFASDLRRFEGLGKVDEKSQELKELTKEDTSEKGR